MAQASADVLIPLLWERLLPERWPVRLTQLPEGTALVGGAIRDALLNQLSDQPDLDFIVPSNAIALAKSLSKQLGGTAVVLDAERDIARLVLNNWTIDLARQDGQTIQQDLLRRDYCVNAIALGLRPWGELWDPTGGLSDLRDGRLRAVSEVNLVDDPLRLLRGPRLISEHPLELEAETQQWIALHRKRLGQAAPERILSELQRLVRGPQADAAIACLKTLDLLHGWAAGEPVPTAVMAGRLNASEAAESLPLARLTALVSDEGLTQLRASRNLRQRCRRLRQWRREVVQCSKALGEQERLQMHQDLEHDLPALILQLPEEQQTAWLERWRDPADPLFHPSNPVDGTMLQRELDLRPGPHLGDVLNHLRLEFAFRRITSKNEAIKAARRFLRKKGTLCD